MFELDPVRFPRLAAYISRLPEGLESHPEARCKASIARGLIDALPRPFDLELLPPALRELVERPPASTEWILETLNTAIYVAAADYFFYEDENAYDEWVDQIGAAVFSSPMYRILMFVASPRRLAKGAERRWSAFHRGSRYNTQLHDWGTETVIEFPSFLFPRVALRAMASAVRAAYRASGAPNATVDILELGEVHAVTRAVWFPEKFDARGPDAAEERDPLRP